MKDVGSNKKLAITIFFFLIYLHLPLPFMYAEAEYTVCLFKIADISTDQANLKYEAMIQSILSAEIENAGYKLNDQSSTEQDKLSLIRGPMVIKEAKELGTQLAITGFYYIENQRITLNLKCYDVEQKNLISGGLRSSSVGLSIYNLVNRMLQNMLSEMKAKYYVAEAKTLKSVETADTADEETVFIESLTFLSDLDGMRISFPDNVLLGEITNGKLLTELPFALHSNLIIEKQKDGYHSQTEQISIKKEVQKVDLAPINKKNHYALEFNSAAGQLLGLGVGFRYYFNPDYFFVSAENYFFVQHSLHAEDKPVFHNDLKVLVGHYLWDANALFRMAVSTGLGDVVTFFSVSGLKPKNDVYINLANIHFELNFSDWSFYIRQEFKYALGIGDNALGRNWLFINQGIPVFSAGILGKW